MKSKLFLVYLLLVQLIIYVVTLLDLSVIRQIIIFAYLTFVPGIIMAALLKLDLPTMLERSLVWVGLSICFQILVGLFADNFYSALGYSEPLSLIPLLVTINSLILLGGIFVFARNREINIFSTSFSLSPSQALLITLPLLSIVGAVWVNLYGNNILLLFLISLVCLICAIGINSEKIVPSKLYPVIILMTAIALLFHASLISSNIVSFGSDVPVEYLVFKTTESNAYWARMAASLPASYNSRLHNLLSITILPTVFSRLMNLDPALVFKIVFPLIFSLVPLGLYHLWSNYISRKYAFISALFFMVQQTFYTEMLGLNRQMIAEFFFLLLLIIVLNQKIRQSGKIFCFFLFGFALVVSHYAIAILFLFFLLFVLIAQLVKKWPPTKISIFMVISFFTMMFLWYIFTSRSVNFETLVDTWNFVFRQLYLFFDPSSRGEMVLVGLGLEAPPTIWNAIGRAFAYSIQFFIVMGFVALIMKRSDDKFDREYSLFIILAMGLLAFSILLPGFARTLNITRLYHISLFFLAPLCILGVKFLLSFVLKQRKNLAILFVLTAILLPYFLFQSGFVYELAGTENWSLPLSGYRMSPLQFSYSLGYIAEADIFGAQWLFKNVNYMNSIIYADAVSIPNVLTAYGTIYNQNMQVLSNVTILSGNDTVYLNHLNVVDGIYAGTYLWNTSSISHVYQYANKIYSNGECEIYKTSDS